MSIVSTCMLFFLIYLVTILIAAAIIGRWFSYEWDYGAALIWPLIVILSVAEFIYRHVEKD